MVASNYSRGRYWEGEWSVGLAKFNHLQSLQSTIAPTPILRGCDFAPWGGNGVADPFAVYRDGQWNLFVELFRKNTDKAVIAVATSKDLVSWKPEGVALECDFHISYPYVFENEGQMYMIPETKKAREVALYQAVEFPLRWKKVSTLLRGRFMDATLFPHAGRFWIVTGWQSYFVRVFYANSLIGPWRSTWLPLSKGYCKASTRPGGRTIRENGNLIRMVQNNTKHYGHSLSAFKIKSLSRLGMMETPYMREALCMPGAYDWNARCMHHADIHDATASGIPQSDSGSRIAFVDGCA